MKLSRTDNQQLNLALTEQELLVLAACIRETFATLDRRDFPLRIGASIDIVSQISQELAIQMRFLRIEQ